jgi:hypothetical protein
MKKTLGRNVALDSCLPAEAKRTLEQIGCMPVEVQDRICDNAIVVGGREGLISSLRPLLIPNDL